MSNSLFHKPIDIRISTVVAISVVLHSLDHATLTEALHEMTGGANDFFDNEFAVIDVGALHAHDLSHINWAQLIQELKAVNLNPVAVRHAPEQLHAAILEHGLSLDNSPKEHSAEHAAEHAQAAESAAAHAEAAHALEAEADAPDSGEAAAAVATAATSIEPPAPAAPAIATIIVDTPVRAGQRIYARGDLIITAVVNNGAEVIADGSIHVYAPLRGRALAGASGNQNARIFAFSMEPELLSIAGMYRTFEDGFPPSLAHTPTQARLIGDRLDLSAVQAGK